MPDQTTPNTLLSPRFLFQFSVPVQRHEPIWPLGMIAKGKRGLADQYVLPDLASLDAGSPSSERRFADVRLAWHEEGIAITAEVTGKSQPLWCRESRIEDSDGLFVWIDTRATHNIHRASRFCHAFAFLPTGGGRGNEEPVADQVLINRARENARPVRPRELQVASKVTKEGYHLSGFVPAVALEGYDPSQYQTIGFHYQVVDRELGMQTFANGLELPADEDPSCWATLELGGSAA